MTFPDSTPAFAILAAFLERFGELALTAYWLPQLVWALVALAVLGLLRVARPAQPLVSYQVATGLLLALPAGLLAAPFFRFQVTAPFAYAAPALPEIAVGSAPATAALTLNGFHVVGALTLVALVLTALQLGQLAGRYVTLRRLSRALPANAPAALKELAAELAAKHGVATPVRLVVSQTEASPVTFGWRRPVLVLPASLLDDDEALRMTIEHELVHIANGDYARGLGEQLVRASFFLNPLVHGAVRMLERYRELACDAELLRQPAFSRKRYASLLARFALTPAPERAFAVHMSSAGRLKERVVAMRAYKGSSMPPRVVRMTALGAAGVLFAASIALIGCEVTFDQSVSVNHYGTPDAEERAPSDEEVFIVVEHMPELVGGLQSLQERLRYPDLARNAGIEGRVFIQFVVDANGQVLDPKVVRGIGGGCDEEALRAVAEATFRPGRQRGIAVPVRMSIPITFKLEPAEEAAS